MKNKLSEAIFLIVTLLCCSEVLSAQGYKGIIPLKSTCEDVKRVLKVDECKEPFTMYSLEDIRVSIHFTKDGATENNLCYRVPTGRVLSFTVSFNKAVPLDKFEYKLKFAEKIENDIVSIIYANEEKGVSAYVQDGMDHHCDVHTHTQAAQKALV